ncbi:GNAT family N-acetyltransferase [Pleurocapsa sp. PCC 7319]|uniref:GNAT family N-acetyltransferase n=1 Tax=Pleurocapsa sp. PCC 7319 TaxID=118161 RepID=UPI00034AED2F|nr:GNAT family N-acetyltransferase [Pleurocapsa sp. PCC 7319]
MDTFNFLTSQPDLLSLTIEGERIRLITISNKFEQDIFQEFTNEITTYMFPSPPANIKGTQNFILESRQGIRAANNLQFVVVMKTTGEFLGNCGLHGQGKVRMPELGIWLKKDAHGKGYGQEAVHTLVNWSKKNIDLSYFIYPVDRRNTSSRKIPESLGGHIFEDYQVKTSTGKILDLVVYKIPVKKQDSYD